MKLLSELNASASDGSRDYVWSNTYRIRPEYAIGRVGRMRTGQKMHLLHVSRIIEDLRETPKTGTYRTGDAFSVHGICNGNGQHVGAIVRGLDTASITCEKCIEAIR